jgi:hypothetical protein
MTAQGLMIANGGALASAEVPEHPGTGSAVLGFVQWVAAGTIAPIAGLGGDHTAVPMALIMAGGAVLSMVGLLVLARGGTPPRITTRCDLKWSPSRGLTSGWPARPVRRAGCPSPGPRRG